MIIKSLGENKFVFCFLHDPDKRRVFLDGSWLFNGSLLVLEKPKFRGDIAKMASDF